MDHLLFDGGVSQDQLWFQRSGDNLEVDVIGTTDAVTIAGWYLGTARQVEKITVDGD